MHVAHVIANNSTVPYLSWFAQRIKTYPDVKFTFIVLYHEKPHMIEEMTEYGCNTYWIKFDPNRRKSGMVFVFFKLLKLFRELKPDVVNAHLFDDSVPALLAARLAGVKKE